MAHKPRNGWVLLRRIEEKSDSLIERPDSLKEKSDKGEVISASGQWQNGKWIETDLCEGDIVLMSHYGTEDIELDGEKLCLCRDQEIKLVEPCGEPQIKSAGNARTSSATSLPA